MPEVCLNNNEKELCLKPNFDETSKEKILDYFETWVTDSEEEGLYLKTEGDYTISCYMDDSYVSCSDPVVGIMMRSYGGGAVLANDKSIGLGCMLSVDGIEGCSFSVAGGQVQTSN